MKPLVACIQAAGAVQWIIAAANFFLPQKLRYRESLERVSPIVRQLFIVHCAYIVLVLFFFGGLCIWFAPELTGSAALGRTLSAFLAIFWIARVAIQLFYYDRETRRKDRWPDAAFIAAFAFLGGVFAAAAWGGLR